VKERPFVSGMKKYMRMQKGRLSPKKMNPTLGPRFAASGLMR
jgi:hypothetical protein